MTTKMTSEPVPILFRCPCCKATLSIPVEQSGVTGPCPHCSQIVRSPERSTSAEQEVEDLEPKEEFSLKTLIPFEKHLQWDAEDKVWRQRQRIRVVQRAFWEGIATNIDSRKTLWAIAAVFVLFMGTVAYRDGYNSTAGRAAAMGRAVEFSMPEGLSGEMGVEPAVRWMPTGGFFSDRLEVPEP